MGTHPIFESDFDCLTEKWKKYLTISTPTRRSTSNDLPMRSLSSRYLPNSNDVTSAIARCRSPKVSLRRSVLRSKWSKTRPGLKHFRMDEKRNFPKLSWLDSEPTQQRKHF